MAFQGAIFEVDGVLVDSPHELAWRESLQRLMETDWRQLRDQTSWTPERFTSDVYQEVMSGKPRLAGARAALEHFGVPDVEARAEEYGAAKQEQIIRLISEGRFMSFPDALRFILGVKATGIRVAAASSSSKNAGLFLERIRLDTFAAEQRLDYDFLRPRMTLEELFDADISGRDFPRGKPDPAIFLTAAAELGLEPAGCFVVEDASSGVQESDVADVQGGTTAEGIHLGAMAGTVDIVLRCLAGLRPRGEVLRFDPALPPQVKQVRFSVHYRGHRVDVTLAEDRLEVSSRPGQAQPIQVLVGDQTVELACGASHQFFPERRP